MNWLRTVPKEKECNKLKEKNRESEKSNLSQFPNMTPIKRILPSPLMPNPSREDINQCKGPACDKK